MNVSEHQVAPPKGAKQKTVKLTEIVRDPKAQPRVSLSTEVIEEYAESFGQGAEFPPIVLFFDGAQYFLADGFHRVAAADAAKKKSLKADVYEGGLRDAILYSVSANATHGLQRSHKDKRRAVSRLLEDKEWSQWSNRAIARLAGVGHHLVADMRTELEAEAPKARKVKRGTSTYTMQPGDKPEEPVKPAAPKVVANPAPQPEPEKPGLSGKMNTLDEARAFAEGMSKEPPGAMVSTFVGVNHEMIKFMPSPEAAAQLLISKGITVSPNRLIQIAKWYEGLAFALDQR